MHHNFGFRALSALGYILAALAQFKIIQESIPNITLRGLDLQFATHTTRGNKLAQEK